MSRFETTVRVVANPYHRLDHKGRPCCAVPLEPVAFGGHLGFVGATVDRKATTAPKAEKGALFTPRQETVFSFSEKPVTVLRTPYYQDELKSGSLLPADEAAAKFAGVKFRPVAQAIAETKKASEAEFEREYGEGSLRALGRVEEDEKPTAEKASPAPAPSETSEEDSADEKSKSGRGRGKGNS